MFNLKKRRLRNEFLKALNDLSLSQNANYDELKDFYDDLFSIIEKYEKIYDNLTKKDRMVSIVKLKSILNQYLTTIQNIHGIYIQLLECDKLNYEIKKKISEFAKQSVSISDKTISVLDRITNLLSKEI